MWDCNKPGKTTYCEEECDFQVRLDKDILPIASFEDFAKLASNAGHANLYKAVGLFRKLQKQSKNVTYNH